ncbi:hypothetical protein MANY_32170 [Mycolicibacterium anyangense]|uniref:Uncharacterized protein n=1 Tax=Mycolicibacterium anyangense TaxID=1431246 RepID=A0A6N4W7C2_9MYCO|nr:hypothetical protein MANY_32170 [Mycolicibacterium anyangense]
MTPPVWPEVCTGATVGAWLKKVRRTSRPMPSNSEPTEFTRLVKTSVIEDAEAAALGTRSAPMSSATGAAAAVGALGLGVAETVTTVVAVPGAAVETALLFGLDGPESLTADSGAGARPVRPVAGRRPTTVRVLTVVPAVVRAAPALEGSPADADPGAVVAEVRADRAEWPVAVPDFAGPAELDPESWSGPSAAAIPRACGPASDNPTANAAAPIRTLIRGVDIALPAFPASAQIGICGGVDFRVRGRLTRPRRGNGRSRAPCQD